jgi:A/G-specific adenine glycosylase
MRRMNTKAFRQIIYGHFEANPRLLPWRNTSDPYHVLISEIMLQQTQVERVLPKYEAFLGRFPTPEALAEAPLADVLAQWQGLGYNRRGLMLKRAAEAIVAQFGGIIPSDPADLARLPGIGPYTAGAIAAFAFGHPSPFIETNIRSVFIHFFFSDRTDVSDREILPLVERTMDRDNIRDWYNALMDYGVMLKKTLPNPSRRSRQHAVQKPFRGSNREIRGEILRLLLATPGLTATAIVKQSGKDRARVRDMLEMLQGEGLLQEQDGGYRVG